MMSRFNSAHNMFACYTRSYSLTRSSAKSIRFGLASAPFLACSSCNVGLCRDMTAMLGRRYSKSVEEEDGTTTGSSWTEDGNRRQHYNPLQLHLCGSRGRRPHGTAQ